MNTPHCNWSMFALVSHPPLLHYPAYSCLTLLSIDPRPPSLQHLLRSPSFLRQGNCSHENRAWKSALLPSALGKMRVERSPRKQNSSFSQMTKCFTQGQTILGSWAHDTKMGAIGPFLNLISEEPITKPVNSNLGWESSLHFYDPLLPRLSAFRAAWLVWTQQRQEMSPINLNFSW